ncbi:MAG: hypothetical protein AAF206_19900, partial [Bacteroidota bacterium]
MPTISVPQEFSLSLCLQHLGRSEQERTHYVREGEVFRAIQTPNGPFVLRIFQPDWGTLQVEGLNRSPDQQEEKLIHEMIWEWFDLDRDLGPFYTMAKDDPLLGPAVT